MPLYCAIRMARLAAHTTLYYQERENSMEFTLVLARLLDEFTARGIRYAACGGFAVGVLGAPRTTADLDFLVHREDLPALEAAMDAMGYSRRHQSENVSQFSHPEAAWGSLDFIHAFRPHSLNMLSRARSFPVASGKAVRVLEAEDVIGLKVQAMANDPRRTARERADIEALVEANSSGLDWGRVEEYYALFDRAAEFTELKGRFGASP